jgi:hypothetical protein
MSNKSFLYSLTISITLFVWSCVKEPEFSTTPAISFSSIQKITKTSNDGFGGKTKIDSIIMSIRFEDGDGDLGITAAEMKENAKYKDFRNFEVDVLLKKNGKYNVRCPNCWAHHAVPIDSMDPPNCRNCCFRYGGIDESHRIVRPWVTRSAVAFTHGRGQRAHRFVAP